MYEKDNHHIVVNLIRNDFLALSIDYAQHYIVRIAIHLKKSGRHFQH